VVQGNAWIHAENAIPHARKKERATASLKPAKHGESNVQFDPVVSGTRLGGETISLPD
jgi:hypothetical protein